jgi:hypothetical protein
MLSNHACQQHWQCCTAAALLLLLLLVDIKRRSNRSD